MYAKVYAPNGELFEVPEERAAELKLQFGWTSAKVSEEAPEPEKPVVTFDQPDLFEAPKKRTRRKVE